VSFVVNFVIFVVSLWARFGQMPILVSFDSCIFCILEGSVCINWAEYQYFVG